MTATEILKERTMPYRLGTGIAAGTAAPTAETVVATIMPGAGAPTDYVVTRADCPLTGGASTTSITLQIRRGTTTAGASLASAAFTVAGAVTVGATLAIAPDNAYDGTGYCLTAQAAGAAGTCGPGLLETEISYAQLGFG